MKIARAIPNAEKGYSVVVEVFENDFCQRAGWTKTKNIPSDTEDILFLNDADTVGVGWRLKNGELSDPSDPKLWDAKSRKKEEIADARWNAEIGGVEFGGMHMHTDRDSQAKYIGAIVAFQATGKLPQAWKGIDGWLPITQSDTLMGLAIAVQEHVNDCYMKEAMLEALIDKAKNKTELEAIKWN